MKKITILSIIFLILLSFSEVNAQGTETFEAPLAIGSTSFTRAGLTFSTGTTNFKTDEFPGAAAGGSDRYIDNISNAGLNKTYSISITGGATLYTMQTMEIYVSSDPGAANPTNDGTMTFVGKVAGATVFTYTKTGGFPTSFGTTNGYFLLDFATDPASDLSNTNIDELEISINGLFQYVSVDNFAFDNEVLAVTPPVCQSISVVGTPNSTATAVDFQVIFDEAAFNVSTGDFAIDAVGTSGTVSAVSGSGTTYIVSVTGISGEGTISIDLIAGNDIEDGLGNAPSPPFTAGATHTVSRCFQETFESYIVGNFVFASNGVGFTTSTSNFSVENFPGGGAGGSDQLLSNTTDEGTGKIYSITTSGPELFNVEALDVYLSSQAEGANPTDDGSIIFRGKLTGGTLFTITKNSGFPTTFAVNNGFSTIDFETAGAADYSLTNIDELEIEIGGAFSYIGFDNFEHCEEVATAAPPIVQSISLVGNPPASAVTLSYDVIFNENAVNVTIDDFGLTQTGSAVGTVASVTGSANTYQVMINGISGEGTIRLDLNPFTDIEDESGNTPPDAFTSGEVHLVTSCDVETFESYVDMTFMWTTGTTPFTTGAATLSVDEFIGAGAGASDRYIDNLTDQGTGKSYSISITDISIMEMGSMEVYLSSVLNGDNPTDDGTLTVTGKRNGVTQYTVVKSSGFPTTNGSTQGFYFWDFATEGGSDNSMTEVDEIMVELGGAFQYIAIDNFKFCTDKIAPDAVCQNISLPLDAMGNATLTPSQVDNGSTDDSGTLFLAFETLSFDGEITVLSPTDEIGAGIPTPYEGSVFTVPTSGNYTFTITSAGFGGFVDLVIWNDTPIPNSGAYHTRPEYVALVAFDSAGTPMVGSNVFAFQADTTYYMSIWGDASDFGTFTLSVDLPIRTTAATTVFTCADIGPNPVTLYAFDAAGNTDSCSSTVTVADSILPTISCPGDQTVMQAGNYTLPDYVFDGDVIASDNCNFNIVQTPAPATSLPDGDYVISFVVTDAGSNTENCSFMLKVVDTTLSVDDYELTDSDIVLFPNPASGDVTIRNNSNAELLNLTIIDVKGSVLERIDLRDMGLEKIISTQNYANGVYFMKINTRTNSIVKRLIKL